MTLTDNKSDADNKTGNGTEGKENTPPAKKPSGKPRRKPRNNPAKGSKNKGDGGKEKQKFRIAVRVNEIMDVTAEGKSQAFEQLKETKLGDLINRDNVSFLGS